MDIEILERLGNDSARLIYKVKADGKISLLKGIPDEKPESAIRGNTEAHKFLGEKEIAPRIITAADGGLYQKSGGYWFYLTEFIDGQPMEATVENERLLGELAKQLHSLQGYKYASALNEDKQRFYDWFSDKPYKEEFDKILDTLPDFGNYDRCFIHTDLGPHNAMIAMDGKPILVDLDDSGTGSRYLDLGWAFIIQFTEHTEDMRLSYRFDLAKAFLNGYYGENPIPREEYDLLWKGAVYMHISYMQCYGPYAVDSLWSILKYGLEQKEKLWTEYWKDI
ncbi:MAG: phosphotransferase [Lachnospiraceae bacterium]|nr:phosphotransferase [Lachnospiraceae bacterium]